MTRYAFHEGDMALPEGWIDASMTSLVYERPEGIVRLMVVRLDPSGRDFEEAMQDHLVALRRRLPHYELVHDRPTQVDGRPARDYAIRFVSEQGPSYRRVAVAQTGSLLLLLGAQGAPPAEQSVDTLLETVIGGARWRQEDP